jgi:hypothetical protein
VGLFRGCTHPRVRTNSAARERTIREGDLAGTGSDVAVGDGDEAFNFQFANRALSQDERR